MMRVAGPFDALLDLQVLAPQHTTNHKEIATCRVDGRFARIRLGGVGWGLIILIDCPLALDAMV